MRTLSSTGPAGEVHRVRRHGRDPEPTLRVEGHLHRLLEVGELDLGGEQVGLVAFGQGEGRPRLLGRGQIDRLLDVGLDPFERAGLAVVDRGRDGLPLGDGPDPGLSVLDHLAELGELGREVDDAEGGLASAVDIAAVDGPVVVPELLVLLVDLGLESGNVGRALRGPWAEEGRVDDPADHGVTQFIQVDAVDRQVSPLFLEVGWPEQVDEDDARMGLRDLGHRIGVELDVGVVRLAVGDVGLLDILMGDRREQDQLRSGLAVVLRGGRGLDEGVEVGLELGQPLGAGERLVETEGGDDDVGLLVFQLVAVVLEAGRPGTKGQFVGRPAEVVDDEFEVGESAVEQGLEAAKVLHPLGQGVADDDDPVPLFEFQGGGVGVASGPGGRGDHRQRDQESGSHRWSALSLQAGGFDGCRGRVDLGGGGRRGSGSGIVEAGRGP